VDWTDAFDAETAAAAGVEFERLLWIRCGARKKNALAVTDLLLQNGGWGVIALDLSDIDPKDARRIPLNAWYRFRLALENKPTVFLVVGQQAYAGSCSARIIETNHLRTHWKGLLFHGAVFEAALRKPPGSVLPRFETRHSSLVTHHWS
jgi:hypothetical protein